MSIFCEYCSLKCIASDCDCDCHNKKYKDMNVSLCDSCYCMTHDVIDDDKVYCGKCQAVKKII